MFGLWTEKPRVSAKKRQPRRRRRRRRKGDRGAAGLLGPIEAIVICNIHSNVPYQIQQVWRCSEREISRVPHSALVTPRANSDKWIYILHLHFSHLADTFVQSNLQWETQWSRRAIETYVHKSQSTSSTTNYGAELWRASKEGYKQERRREEARREEEKGECC